MLTRGLDSGSQEDTFTAQHGSACLKAALTSPSSLLPVWLQAGRLSPCQPSLDPALLGHVWCSLVLVCDQEILEGGISSPDSSLGEKLLLRIPDTAWCSWGHIDICSLRMPLLGAARVSRERSGDRVLVHKVDGGRGSHGSLKGQVTHTVFYPCCNTGL